MQMMRFCNGCVRRTMRRRCSCGRATVTMRQRKEWEILCTVAELQPDQYQTLHGLRLLAGNGASGQEMRTILLGMGTRGLVHIERNHDGVRVYRVPGAMIAFHLDLSLPKQLAILRKKFKDYMRGAWSLNRTTHETGDGRYR